MVESNQIFEYGGQGEGAVLLIVFNGEIKTPQNRPAKRPGSIFHKVIKMKSIAPWLLSHTTNHGKCI